MKLTNTKILLITLILSAPFSFAAGEKSLYSNTDSVATLPIGSSLIPRWNLIFTPANPTVNLQKIGYAHYKASGGNEKDVYFASCTLTCNDKLRENAELSTEAQLIIQSISSELESGAFLSGDTQIKTGSPVYASAVMELESKKSRTAFTLKCTGPRFIYGFSSIIEKNQGDFTIGYLRSVFSILPLSSATKKLD